MQLPTETSSTRCLRATKFVLFSGSSTFRLCAISMPEVTSSLVACCTVTAVFFMKQGRSVECVLQNYFRDGGPERNLRFLLWVCGGLAWRAGRPTGRQSASSRARLPSGRPILPFAGASRHSPLVSNWSLTIHELVAVGSNASVNELAGSVKGMGECRARTKGTIG